MSTEIGSRCTRVRFRDAANQEFFGCALDHTEANKRDIWYQPSEMKQIKESALLLARQHVGKYGTCYLDNTYGKNDLAATNAIHAWARNKGERRGLERFHCRNYAKRRTDVKRTMVLSVLNAQHLLIVDQGLTDKGYVAVVLGQLSKQLSAASRKFASLLGQADAAAIQSLDSADTEPFGNCDKTPTPVKRQNSPQSITMLNQYTEVANIMS
jgi:hypothetical protein